MGDHGTSPGQIVGQTADQARYVETCPPMKRRDDGGGWMDGFRRSGPPGRKAR